MLRAYEARSATKPGEALLIGEFAEGLPQQTVSSFETCAQVVVAPAAMLIDAGRSADSFEVLRAKRLHAEFLLRASRYSDALPILRELRDQQTRKESSPIESGLALDLLGEAELKAGDSEAARVAHEAARSAFARQLSTEHPYLIRNATLRNSVSHTLERS